LKKKAQAQFTTPDNPLIFASDIDKKAIKASADNFSMPEISSAIHLEKTDFFAMSPDMVAGNRKGVIMLNPPYGKRLGKQKQTHSFYREIGKKLAMDFKGWRVGIILPDRKTYTDLGIKLALQPIFHGGLDVFAGIGRI